MTITITDVCDADKRTLDPNVRNCAACIPAPTAQQIAQLVETINTKLIPNVAIVAAALDRLPSGTRTKIVDAACNEVET